jgi:HSP20 family protein
VARVGTESPRRTPTWTPAVDIYETDGNLVFKAELPGVDPNQVQVRVEENKLYLEGERSLTNGAAQDKYQQMERAYGPFARSFVLPRPLDAENITAEYKDGLLIISIAKREEVKPKAIEIKVAAH